MVASAHVDGDDNRDGGGLLDAPRLSARELILALFDSADAPELTAAYLIAAGRLFDVDANAIRVAIARLAKNDVLVTRGRARYGLGATGRAVYQRVQAWADVGRSVVPWNGGSWLAVSVGHLKRSAKTAVRARERALRLHGFSKAPSGLWVRPDNLAGAADALHARLIALGLDRQAHLFCISAQVPADALDPSALWDIVALEGGYAARTEQLAASTTRVAGLAAPDAARETLQLGRAVTRDILMDPLLPEQMIDTAARARMVTAMTRYNRLGRRCWAVFAAQAGATDAG